MHELIGHMLTMDEGDYEIVEVRQVGSDILVYAEADRRARRATGLIRTAFRYADIVPYLDQVRPATPGPA